MASLKAVTQHGMRSPFLIALALATLSAVCSATVVGQQSKIDVLKIGTSGTLTAEGGGRNEKSSLDTLKSFIKDETGLDSEINREKDWRALAEKLSKGQLNIGVFQGIEYARAEESYPGIKPLALAVNVYVYPVAYVVVGRDNSATNFAGLQGKSLGQLGEGARFLQIYINRQCELLGKKPADFFSKIVPHDNFEDAIDDVVEGTVDAAVADRAALDAYKRRKPGRFAKLKPIAQSERLPPAVIAYYGAMLDETTRNQFRDGLLGASNKEKGQTMLTLFRLTGFQSPPPDFEKVLAETRKAYPAEDKGAGK